jgi:molecular chaperone DnaJ
MVQCSACRGKGKYEVVGEETCSSCVGTGRDMKSDLYSDYCRRCNGKGKIPYIGNKTCSRCNGKGYN